MNIYSQYTFPTSKSILTSTISYIKGGTCGQNLIEKDTLNIGSTRNNREVRMSDESEGFS